MIDAFTPGAQRALSRAQARARSRNALAVEPSDLLVALVDEAESRAAELLVRFGLEPARLLAALSFEPQSEAAAEVPIGDPAEGGGEAAAIPHSAACRSVLSDAIERARATVRSNLAGTEHLLAGLLSDSSPVEAMLEAAGVALEPLRGHLAESIDPGVQPIPPPAEIPPLDLAEPARDADLARILDASANRAREGLRVVEDFVRFALDDPGLTRRVKEVRHRLADALAGLGNEHLLAARDTPGDVGTHIMTHSERIRENPQAVLTANFKRTTEALRSLEEYGKLVDVWLAGRFEVLRYDVYTLEKLVLTAVASFRPLGTACLMVLVGGLPTLGELTWVVGEALSGGADVIQLREKGLNDRELLRRAREVRILTAQAGARFILNDRADLARLAAADGVHLGQQDLSVRDARRIVGPRLLIGVSTHTPEQIQAAILAGANYLGVGPVFPSATKEFSEPELAGLALVQSASETTSLPWFAIGGITEANLPRVLAAGASRIAVSAAVVRADRPRLAAARLKAALEGKPLPDLPPDQEET
jgi:thiamine-phosphate pyrophosphorylase